MTIDTEKQFAGNYVRLVNQCRDLQSDITVKDRMIDFMAETILAHINTDFLLSGLKMPKKECHKDIVINQVKKYIEVEENNKKASNCESI